MPWEDEKARQRLREKNENHNPIIELYLDSRRSWNSVTNQTTE